MSLREGDIHRISPCVYTSFLRWLLWGRPVRDASQPVTQTLDCKKLIETKVGRPPRFAVTALLIVVQLWGPSDLFVLTEPQRILRYIHLLEYCLVAPSILKLIRKGTTMILVQEGSAPLDYRERFVFVIY